MNNVEEEWFEDFCQTLTTEKSKASYKTIINAFLSYTNKEFIMTSKQDAYSYVELLKASDQKDNTVYTKISVLSSFASYLVDRELTPSGFENWFIHVERPYISPYISPDRMPTIEEIEKLLNATKDDIKYYTILSLVIRCGLSEKELHNLNIGDFIVDKEYHKAIRITSKRNVRHVKLPDDVSAILDRYFNEYGYGEVSDPVFLSNRNSRLSERTLRYNINKINIKAGIAEPYTLQDLRNYAAALMLKSGANTTQVANTLGIGMKWMQRYNRAIADLDVTPIDTCCLTIK